jgi:hypothetical protein
MIEFNFLFLLSTETKIVYFCVVYNTTQRFHNTVK